ncbi:MAG: glycosyltransferase family 4 protein ['Candidatus Kapabacteria' thiocyanatum]|nr:glycosyltransferase family 4 protein ['Candidatus Kapabacteria' thiocyanatum]
MLNLLSLFPPPYGGVAIHAVRLLECLIERNIDVRGFSLTGVPDTALPISKVSLFDVARGIGKPGSIVHYHSDEGNWKTALLASRYWRHHHIPYIVTLHSFRPRDVFTNGLIRNALRRAYDEAATIICISEEVRSSLAELIGVQRDHCTVIPSNLPVSSFERERPLDTSIPSAWTNAPVRIVANAGRVVRFGGEDLYGIDVLLKAVTDLRHTAPDVSLLIVVGNDVVNHDLYAEWQRMAEQDAGIHLVNGHRGPLLPAVLHSHIVVRPTRTEGGPSLTLSEALECGRIAIGSDAVPRLPGCRLFANGSDTDLLRALREAVLDVQLGRLPLPRRTGEDILPRLLDVYRRSGLRLPETTGM